MHFCLFLRPDEFKFGCTSLRVPPELLYQLRNDITVSPNGIVFVKVQALQISPQLPPRS